MQKKLNKVTLYTCKERPVRVATDKNGKHSVLEVYLMNVLQYYVNLMGTPYNKVQFVNSS